MEINGFQVRSYGWQELALLYGPELTPMSASKRLTRWVLSNDPLVETLRSHGWRKGAKQLTPLLVADIVRHFGEP